MIIKLLKRFWEFIKSIWHKLTSRKKDATTEDPATPSRIDLALAKKDYLINFKEKQSFVYNEMLRWGREGFKRKVEYSYFAGPSYGEIAANFKITYDRMKKKPTSDHEMTNLLDKIIKKMARNYEDNAKKYEDDAKNISSAAKGH